SQVRKLEVRVVEEVKELSSENQSKALAQLEGLVGREVKVHVVGTAQDGASRIPKHARRLHGSRRRVDRMRGKHESGLIEPAIERLMAITAQQLLPWDVKGKILRVVDDVWTRRE